MPIRCVFMGKDSPSSYLRHHKKNSFTNKPLFELPASLTDSSQGVGLKAKASFSLFSFTRNQLLYSSVRCWFLFQNKSLPMDR